MTLVIFIIILAVLVLVHELGHFLVAKWSGVRVDEFGLGFPPRIFSKRIGETLYSINLIPFGGFVKIFGENPNDESIKGPDSDRSFVNKNRVIQLAVLVAGIAFNLIFAWILMSAGFMTGLPALADQYDKYEVRDSRLSITAVYPKSPASEAGLRPGDIILKIREYSENEGIKALEGESLTPENAQLYITEHAEKLIIEVSRGSEAFSFEVTPREGIVEHRAVVGIAMDIVGILELPAHYAFFEGAKLTISLVKAVSVGIYDFLKEAILGRADLTEVTGPIGIASLVGTASKLGFVYLISFTAFISINLALLNLIPFPALDGGRMLFVIIEAIRRKSINPRIANTANTVGFAILIALMLVVTYKDILKLI